VLTFFLHFFRAIFEGIERGIYAVDEWLRFREGDSRPSFWFKVAFGAVWFFVTYVFRFAWGLLVEPQINPVKHFPVVTVSHKILLPLVPSLASQFGIAKDRMFTIVFGIPGIFGFLAWELKENWKLYRANAPKDIRPIQVGSHGETTRGLLRPGFHSGTVPKLFTRLRRAVRAGRGRRATRTRHSIEHVAEAVARFGGRSLIADLRHSTRWAGAPAELGEPVLGPNRIVLPVHVGAAAPVEIALEHQHGWIIGSIAGPLDTLEPPRREAFADALLGFYKRAGVHVVREQVAAVFGPQACGFDARPDGLLIPLADGKEQLFDFDETPRVEAAGRTVDGRDVVLSECPLPWADWVARWEADAEGGRPSGPLIRGWTVLG
jgi:hypothetical protein